MRAPLLRSALTCVALVVLLQLGGLPPLFLAVVPTAYFVAQLLAARRWTVTTDLGAGVCIAGFMLFAIATKTQARWLAVLGAACLAAVFGPGLVRRPLRDGSLTRTMPRLSHVDDRVTVTYAITNPSRRTAPAVRLFDIDAGEGVQAVIEPIRGGETREVNAVTTMTRRGRFSDLPHVFCNAPFGMSGQLMIEPDAEEYLVAPRLVRLRWPDQAASGRADLATVGATRGVGFDVHGVREHRRGDPLRHVHWRSTARTGRLVVREFEQPPDQEVSFVCRGPEGPELELLLSAVASIVTAAERAGVQVRSCCLEPECHETHEHSGTALRELFAAHAADDEQVAYLDPKTEGKVIVGVTAGSRWQQSLLEQAYAAHRHPENVRVVVAAQQRVAPPVAGALVVTPEDDLEAVLAAWV